MNSIESKFSKLLENEVGGQGLGAYTPSMQLQVYASGRKKIDLNFGEEFLYFDLASLTKIIFTTTAFMRLLDQKKIDLKDRVSSQCLDWPHTYMSVEMLLKHHAGLHWWNNYYSRLEKAGGDIHQRRQYLWTMLLQEKARKSPSQAIYSDLDFLVLGYFLESIEEKDLFDIWEDLSVVLGLKSVHFCKNNIPKYKSSQYAPTENCPWRGKILQGEVHDDNTWSLGGVCSHAGLFGNIEDVSLWGLMLRRAYLDKSGKHLAKSVTVRKFAKRSMPSSTGDWGLGFMKPTSGSASCGQRFSLSSIGHTGFTGTSFWWDPQKDVMVTLLSNRVHPTRDNKKFVQLRPKIHDWVMESLK